MCLGEKVEEQMVEMLGRILAEAVQKDLKLMMIQEMVDVEVESAIAQSVQLFLKLQKIQSTELLADLDLNF